MWSQCLVKGSNLLVCELRANPGPRSLLSRLLAAPDACSQRCVPFRLAKPQTRGPQPSGAPYFSLPL